MAMSLAHKQARCLLLIQTCIEQNGMAPSYREMRVAMGIANISGVAALIERLKKRGRISTRFGQKRSIEVLVPLTAAEIACAKGKQSLPDALRAMADRLEAREVA